MRRLPRAALIVVLALGLCGCAGETDDNDLDGFRPVGGAAPSPRDAPLHIDRQGNLAAEAGANSFFPLALDNALVDFSRGARFGFAAAAEAGFNAVAPWQEQPAPTVMDAATGSRLQVVAENAPRHPFATEAGRTLRLRLRGFGQAEAAGAGLAERLQPLIEAAADGARPVWAVLPAYASPRENLRLPTAAEARALAYGALIGGATGLVWFAQDSYASRNAGALGIAPAAPVDYGIRTGTGAAPLVVDGAMAGQSSALWDAVAQVNREAARLVPALLGRDAKPQAALWLSEETREDLRPDRPPPLRLRLKEHDGRLTLLLVNLSARPQAAVILLPRRVSRIERWFEPGPAPELLRGGAMFREALPPLGVRVYRLTPAPGA